MRNQHVKRDKVRSHLLNDLDCILQVLESYEERDAINFFLDKFSGMCAEKIDFGEWWPASERG